jgi:hypothetical protein
MANGLSMDRLTHRVAAVTSKQAQGADCQVTRSAAMILGPDRVLTWHLSSRG